MFFAVRIKKESTKFLPQENFWVFYDRYFILELFEKHELYNVSIIKNTARIM